MTTINVRVDYKNFQRGLNDLEKRQAPFAMARALTWTAQDIKKNTVKRLDRVIDRPTRFTKNAFRVTPAKKKFLQASVGARVLKETASGFKHYLEPLEFGGPRDAKRFEKKLRREGFMTSNEYAEPARALRLNRYGNISKARLLKIIAEVKKGEAEAGASKYFVMRSRDEGGLRAGIYQRYGRGGSKQRLLIVFVRRPKYRSQLGFRDGARKTARARLRGNFERSLAQAIESSGFKGR